MTRGFYGDHTVGDEVANLSVVSATSSREQDRLDLHRRDGKSAERTGMEQLPDLGSEGSPLVFFWVFFVVLPVSEVQIRVHSVPPPSFLAE